MSVRTASLLLRFNIRSLALLLCFFITVGWAQTTTLSGTVKDPSGGAVGQAVVSVTEAKTSAKKQTVTNDVGGYSFADLAPGDYTVEVSAPGFAVFQKQMPLT